MDQPCGLLRPVWALIIVSLGADKVLAGGAILAGCFFGDRCSPMSGSAMLVANLTKTKVNHNVGRMARTAAVPFILSCLAYTVLGTTVNTSAVAPDVSGMFATTFHLSWLVILPALVIVVLSFLRVTVKTTMLASLGCACVLCLVLQGFPIAELPALLVFGYQCPNPAIASMLNGVCTMIKHVANRYTPFVGVLLTSLITEESNRSKSICSNRLPSG
ncbi:MAG: Na+/H+ antiporter NhaC family protein [Coriobacteriaceae bacterium]